MLRRRRLRRCSADQAPGVYSTGTYTDRIKKPKSARLFLPLVASAVFVAVMTTSMVAAGLSLFRITQGQVAGFASIS
jgi:hypothetical protein